MNHAEVAHDCMLETKLLSITDDFEAGDMAQQLETLDALPEDPAPTWCLTITLNSSSTGTLRNQA